MQIYSTLFNSDEVQKSWTVIVNGCIKGDVSGRMSSSMNGGAKCSSIDTPT